MTLFERTLPWDHGAGALFLEEAGGVIRRNDGSAYLTGDGGTCLLGAASQRLWDDAARILLKVLGGVVDNRLRKRIVRRRQIGMVTRLFDGAFRRQNSNPLL